MRDALRRRNIYAAVVLHRGASQLWVARAAGASAIMVAMKELPRLAGLPGTPPLVDVRPLVDEDPQGNVLNLALLPLIIFGVVVPVLLTTLAPALPVRARIAVGALFALLAGSGAMLVTHVALGALPGPFWALAGITVLLSLAVVSCTTAFIALRGPAGAAIGVVLFLVIGNVASGASVVNELLPGFWRTVGPYLPPGAAADALRSTAYFDGAHLLRPLLVLTGFAAAGILVDLVLGERRPAAQGDPSGASPDQAVAKAS